MAKFRKKPVVIDAWQWTWEMDQGLVPWPVPAVRINAEPAFIRTLEGDMKISVGDWIIKGVKGEFYPCKPDIFAATYDRCEDGDDDGETFNGR